MGLRTNTNIQSLQGMRALTQNHEVQNKTLERLASGNRINRSGDDAAGLAISEKLKANIRSLKQATRNANDGVSMIQVAEGGMNEISNVLVRLRELSIQGASDTIGDLERSYIDREVQGLKQEVTRISNSIEFNGTKLLNGSAPTMEIQVGTHNNPEQDRFVFDTKRNIATLDALGLGDVSTVSKMNSQDNLDKIDSALNAMSSSRAELGALQNRLTSTINNMGIYRENLEAANSRIRDADIAEETSELTKYNILTQANISVLSQANQNASLALKLLS